MQKKLFLLDAFALIFRAYFAFSKNPLINSKGQNVSAVQGFLNTLVEILDKQKPTHIAVCFDTSAPTERHTDFEAYKANRQETPEDISWSVPIIKNILRAMNISVVEKDGYEADDVIGTLAKEAEKEGFNVYMVTPDKDYGQLVSDKVFIYKPPFLGNSYEIMGVPEVLAKWNIPDVNHVIDILGLMGDSVDNIPGLPGVGEKTASKLINEFGTIENLIANTDKLKGKLQQTVIEHKDLALLSKKLATIILNVPIEFDAQKLERREVDKPVLTELFRELEFRTLGKKLIGSDYSVTGETSSKENGTVETKGPQTGVQNDLFGNVVESAVTEEPHEEDIIIKAEKNIENTPHTYTLVETDEQVNSLLSILSAHDTICFDTETTSADANNADLVGMSFSVKAHEGYYVPLSEKRDECKATLNKFLPIFNDTAKTLAGQNIKYDALVLKWYGIELKGKLWDTMLAHYLMEPDKRHGMDYMSEVYLGYAPVSIETLIGKKGKFQGNMRDADVKAVAEYASEDADVTLQLYNVFLPKVNDGFAKKLFYDVEMPLMSVLADMEFEGIAIDKQFLHDYSAQLEKECRDVEQEIYKDAGVRFNIASPKQLGEVLFEKMKIPYAGKKTKTGQYSTDEDTLQKLAHEQPIVDKILDFREYTKLKSTYVDALPLLVNPKSHRVHTTYAQAVAATGRLSSNNPNLQNIPIRTERGKEIRKAFVPRNDEYVLLSADYSQIELRIVAAIAKDEAMIEAFKSGKDIHAATAARVFNVDEKDVTKEMRYKAKSVNFGIIYGQGAFGLAANLGISRGEAKEIIDNYNARFTGIKRYMDTQVNFAREHGYVETILGRRRYLADITSRNATVRGYAERNAINAPIQGSAADMIKVAMVNVQNEIRKNHMKSRMLLQVHDELVFDAHHSEVDTLKTMVEEKMRTAIELDVPIEVGMGTGNNWLDAH